MQNIKHHLKVCLLIHPLPTNCPVDALRQQWYQRAHCTEDITLCMITGLVWTVLYARRLSPYFVYNILGAYLH